jgi:hypothetical protein
VLVAVCVGVALFGLGFGVGRSSVDSGGDADPLSGDARIDPDPLSDVDPDPLAGESPANSDIKVTTRDVTIDYVVLDEQCFDTAGSTMRAELSPALATTSSLSLEDFSAVSVLVTYDITNTEGGVTRGSFVIERGRYATETESLSFARCNTDPNIVVTGVTPR